MADSSQTTGLIPQPHGGMLAPPFPKGVSGNPGGVTRKKRMRLAYELLGDMSESEFAAYKPKTIFERNAKRMLENEAVEAAREVTDRVDGKAPMADEDREALGRPERDERDEFLREFLERVGMAAAAGAVIGAQAVAKKERRR